MKHYKVFLLAEGEEEELGTVEARDEEEAVKPFTDATVTEVVGAYVTTEAHEAFIVYEV